MRPDLEESNKFLSRFDARLGGLNDLDYRNLEYLLLKFCKTPLSVLELGSWTGTSACLLAYYAKQFSGKLFCVDSFVGGSNLYNNETIPTKMILKMHLAYYLLDKNYSEIIENTTDNAVTRFHDNFFDIIFIDADHGFEAVKKDILNYLPKLRIGGVMIGHDYGHTSVSEAVNMLLNNRKVLNNIWYYVKE